MTGSRLQVHLDPDFAAQPDFSIEIISGNEVDTKPHVSIFNEIFSDKVVFAGIALTISIADSGIACSSP